MKFIYALIFIFIFVSCLSEKRDGQTENITDKIDSLSEINSSLIKRNSQLNSELIELRKNVENKPETFQNEIFWRFFWNFMVDSTFQKSRIKYPLEYITWKTLPNGEIDLGGEIETNHIKDSEWEYDEFYINRVSDRTQVYDNYNLEFQPTNERVLHSFGIETGGDAKYYFKGFNGDWYLIKKEQLGD